MQQVSNILLMAIYIASSLKLRESPTQFTGTGLVLKILSGYHPSCHHFTDRLCSVSTKYMYQQNRDNSYRLSQATKLQSYLHQVRVCVYLFACMCVGTHMCAVCATEMGEHVMLLTFDFISHHDKYSTH